MLYLTRTYSTYFNSKELGTDLFNLFQIDLDNYLDIKFGMEHHMRYQPSEIERLPFYEYQQKLEKLNDMLKKRKEEEDKQSEEYSKYKNPEAMSGSYMKQASKQMPSTGHIPRMPKF